MTDREIKCPYCGSTHWDSYDGDYDGDECVKTDFAECHDCGKEFSIVYRFEKIEKKS